VLNYLGYSLIERGENHDEALDMIERAVAGDPTSGYVLDSLAWALFKLGRYDEALPHMERSVEMEPTDAILNDHLGDVFWAVGRQREARFQWRRAISFLPAENLDEEQLRRKLEVGLDVVRAEAGEPPLHPAN
jgi:Flp pilus assembly protein TadD